MKMTPTEFAGAQPPIDGYAPDGFRVAGQFRGGASILAPGVVAAWTAAAGPASTIGAEAAAELAPLAGRVDVLLIGVGPELVALPTAFRAALEAAGLRFDPMGTPAACRTYNVLLSEGRRVGAALLPIGAVAPAS